MPEATPNQRRKRFRASGHLVDSGILKEILDAIVREGGSFDIAHFEMGKTNLQPSRLEATFEGPDGSATERIARRLTDLGVELDDAAPARLAPTPAPGVAPTGFYTTTNHETEVRLGDRFVRVERIRMDGAIRVHEAEGRAYRYLPVVGAERAGGSAMDRIRDAIFHGSTERMFAQFVSDEKLSRDDLERMRRLLDDRMEEGAEPHPRSIERLRPSDHFRS